jgi:hypothetical protein
VSPDSILFPGKKVLQFFRPWRGVGLALLLLGAASTATAGSDKPNILFLPHVPCYATQKWFDLYPEERLQLPPVLRGDRRDTPRFSWYLHWSLPEPRLDYLRRKNY